MFKKLLKNPVSLIIYALRWTAIVIPVAIAIGSMVALFLWLLNIATRYRFVHPWLLYLLPIGGIIIHFLYKLWGRSSEKGNNLIIDEIHEPGAGVPKRMAPLILITTVITHFFGGSAGREGTAVQIGGSLANFFAGLFRLNADDKKMLLTAGIAAGFGAVFGTPLTGAIFALEVLTIGRISYKALLPCLIAGFAGDVTVALWGVHHTAYHIGVIKTSGTFYSRFLPTDFLLLAKVILAGAIFGLVSWLFAQTTHGVKKLSLRVIKTDWLMPMVGGVIIIGLTFAIGKPDYLGLGVEAQYPGAITIVSAFQHGGAAMLSWLWKLVFTAITLGTGFKGGEVTPLFYIGATLGNTLADVLNAPVSLFAALGFIAVFAGATNTPLACTIMGVELFGGEHTLLFAVACFTAYLCSGESGIYSSQRKAGISRWKILHRYMKSGDTLAEKRTYQKTVIPMELKQIIEKAYQSFNARDIDGVLALMHTDVAWPNGWEGGYVYGHDAVRDYWTRQWGEIDPVVTPLTIEVIDNEHVRVEVRQFVKNREGNILGDDMVTHAYTFEDSLIKKMEIGGHE